MDSFWNWFCRICLIVFILICINSMVGDFIFRAKYSFPHVSKTVQTTIDPSIEPIQKDLKTQYSIAVNGEKKIYILELMAEYSISGMVVAKNNNFWFRDIMRSDFDDIALLDLGIVWGDLAYNKDLLYEFINFKSKKTLGQARMLQYRWKPGVPWDSNYITSHVSHTHIIPANQNVMGGLLKIKKSDIIKLDGYLVDIYSDKKKIVARTSLSRTDNNATSRGKNGRNAGGACEIMYVTSLQINDKIYK